MQFETTVLMKKREFEFREERKAAIVVDLQAIEID